jgi:tetratricopeptide (TPR) repeat protein
VPPIAAGWISDFFGTCAFQRSEYGRAIGHLMLSFETALATGQIRRAIIVATNIGNGFTSLNAHEAALDWMQRGLDLARPTGWPLSIGMCLMQTAETLRQLGQRDAAQSLLREALATLSPLSGSRAYAVALEYQGDLALDLGNHVAALDSFTRLAARGDALCQNDFQSSARRGQAHALSHLARRGCAGRRAGALALARDHGDASAQIAALNVLADIHTRHDLPGPELMMAPNAVLHYLQLALEIAATIEGYTVPGTLLDAAAREYARSAITSAPTTSRCRPTPRATRPTARKPPAAPSPCRCSTRPNARRPRASTTASWPPPKRSAPKCCNRPAPRWST